MKHRFCLPDFLIICSVLAMGTAIQTRSVQAEVPKVYLEVGTEIPVTVGATVVAIWPRGWRVSSGLGYLPASYVALINEVVQQFPYSYDADTGDLIEETLQNSLIWRTHLGWQTDYGLYFEGGYRLTTLGGGTSTEALLVGITDWEGGTDGSGSAAYDVTSTLHMLDAEVGWSSDITERWAFRTGIGVAATFAASSSVASKTPPSGPARQRFVTEFEAFSERYLVDTYNEYVITPVLSIALAYRLL